VAGEAVGFQPALCASHVEALAEARRWLEIREDCDTIDVLVGDTELFQVGRAD
jgi:hypothetical protein